MPLPLEGELLDSGDRIRVVTAMMGQLAEYAQVGTAATAFVCCMALEAYARELGMFILLEHSDQLETVGWLEQRQAAWDHLEAQGLMEKENIPLMPDGS